METTRVIVPGPGYALTRAVVPRPDRIVAIQRMERKMAIHDKIDHAPGEDQFDFNFGFLGFDVDFCFSLKFLKGFIAVDETVTKIFTFTNNEVSNFHLFLRDMIVAFVNEGFFNTIETGKKLDLSSTPLGTGDGVLFLKPSPRMASRSCALLAALQPCLVTPPIPGLPEIRGMTIPVIMARKSLFNLSRMAEFLTPGHFLDMIVAEQARLD